MTEYRTFSMALHDEEWDPTVHGVEVDEMTYFEPTVIFTHSPYMCTYQFDVYGDQFMTLTDNSTAPMSDEPDQKILIGIHAMLNSLLKDIE